MVIEEARIQNSSAHLHTFMNTCGKVRPHYSQKKRGIIKRGRSTECVIGIRAFKIRVFYPFTVGNGNVLF